MVLQWHWVAANQQGNFSTDSMNGFLLIEAGRGIKTSNHSPELTAAGRVLYVSKLARPLMILLQQCLSRSLRGASTISTYMPCLQRTLFDLSISSHPNTQTFTHGRAHITMYVFVSSWRSAYKNVQESALFHHLKDAFPQVDQFVDWCIELVDWSFDSHCSSHCCHWCHWFIGVL